MDLAAVPLARGGRSCVVMWRPMRGAAGEVAELRRGYGCVYDRPPRTSEEANVIDRLREQIQERLEQLTGEADRLRKALAALNPRTSTAPARKPPAPTQSTKPTATATKSGPPRRPSTPATRSARRTAPGATKTAVLAALTGGEAMTAGEVATKAGLARPTVSTTLSKLAKTGEVEKAERGYRIASTTPAAPSSPPE